jgi:hypothetical protein
MAFWSKFCSVYFNLDLAACLTFCPFMTSDAIKLLTTNGTGNCVVVGFLVAFLIIGTAEFFSADVAGIGLRRLSGGFHVSSEIALLRKLFPHLSCGSIDREYRWF